MDRFSYRWRSRPDAAALEHSVDQLRTTVIQLRRDLTDKEGYAAKLELVVRQRSRTIDTLRSKLEQVREQNRRLNAEADRLAEMVRFAPQLDAAMLAPK
jgi:hypothetical protein